MKKHRRIASPQKTLLREKRRHGLGRMSITPEAYRLARKIRGTQHEVAAYLRVARETVARREAGTFAITHEATLALLSMPPAPAPETPPVDNTAPLFPGVTS